MEKSWKIVLKTSASIKRNTSYELDFEVCTFLVMINKLRILASDDILRFQIFFSHWGAAKYDFLNFGKKH